MPRSSMAAIGLLAAVAAASAAAVSRSTAAEAAPVSLLSHRAAYRLSLDEAKAVSGIESVRGGLVLEWRADCSGWLSQQRLGFVAETSEGKDRTVDVRFSSWEARDNSRLRFQVRSFDDGKPEATSGTAVLGDGGKGEARYAEPEGKLVELPPGTLFPTEHVLHLLASARRGERIFDRYVFDGSGPDALSQVVALIGDPREVARAEGAQERRWPVRLSYYAPDSADAEPHFQLSFDIDERGVFNDLVLDYPDFALKGTLEKLEPLAEATCE